MSVALMLLANSPFRAHCSRRGCGGCGLVLMFDVAQTLVGFVDARPCGVEPSAEGFHGEFFLTLVSVLLGCRPRVDVVRVLESGIRDV